ncbi:hypothetical protein [Flexivirga oryzae]|uniref:Uridine kinase n=1 Tax=Flexivirga oryzae TaxID=1794944 RepID=A0A839N5J6_9MICO|nr:uridine kinase [Flexivirga oryzae]
MSDGPSAEQVDLVAGRARAIRTRPAIVAIDGRSGSGKTTFAAALAARLPDAGVVHLDHIYPGWDGLAATPALLAAQVLAPLRRHEPAAFRQFDWEHDEFGPLVAVSPAAVVIVEGAGSSVGLARPYADLRVWLDADDATRKHRALARDGDAYRPHWQRWALQEEQVFGADRTREHADLILRTQ